MNYLEAPEIICAHCEQVFERSTASKRYDFCSMTCEMKAADNTGDIVIKVGGRFPRIGRPDGEMFTFPSDINRLMAEIDHYHNPGKTMAESRTRPMDIFTFLQHPSDPGFKYQYPAELDNLAIVELTTYDAWMKKIGQKTRNETRQVEKKGATVSEVNLTDDFVRGVWEINNETKRRQGKRFPHYGTTLEWTRPYLDTFMNRSILIGVHFRERLIGFVKLVMDSPTNPQYACVLHILSLISERDKSPNNAMIAQAVKSCTERGIKQLAYYNFAYGGKDDDTLQRFKRHNGFERVDVPRYFIPLTVRGEIAMKLGLHRKFSERIPEGIAAPLRKLRSAIK